MAQPRKHETPAARQRAYRQRQALQLESLREAKRLPVSPPLPGMPSTARWNALIEDATNALRIAYDEMTAYAEERSEKWQEGERGEALAARIDAIDDVLQTLYGLED